MIIDHNKDDHPNGRIDLTLWDLKLSSITAGDEETLLRVHLDGLVHQYLSEVISLRTWYWSKTRIWFYGWSALCCALISFNM